jgi:hypothetical protein
VPKYPSSSDVLLWFLSPLVETQAGGPQHVGCQRLPAQYVRGYAQYHPPTSLGRVMLWWQSRCYRIRFSRERSWLKSCTDLQLSSTVPVLVLVCLFGSLFYDAFSVTRVYSVDDTVISEWWLMGKDLVGSGRGLICGIMPAFASMNWVKPRKPQSA